MIADSSIHIFQQKAWYPFSIYYARDKWAELLFQITQFYTKRQEQFSACLVSFSEERGEHIRIVLISSDCNRNFQNEIADFFQLYLDTNPSFCLDTFPYGQALWSNYPNNTLIWDRFEIINHTDEYIRFHQKTFQLVSHLLGNDFSSDNVLSTGIYLITKGLSCFETKIQNDILSNALKKISDTFDFQSKVQLMLDELDENEIYETIESYWRENKSEYSTELIEWLVEVENIKETGFDYFYFLVSNVIGLQKLSQILVLKLLNIWQKKFLFINN